MLIFALKYQVESMFYSTNFNLSLQDMAFRHEMLCLCMQLSC